MKTCLTKRALLLCAGGDGTDNQLAHIAACEHCQERYLRFVRDLATIERVFREPPPPQPATNVHFDFLPRNRWLPVAAAFAATVALIWGVRHFQQIVSPTLVSSPIEQEEELADVVQLLPDDESPVLFAMAEQPEFIVSAPVADARYLEAALNEGWPCEWQDTSTTPICEFYPIPLVFEE